jgi:hypothetical protein
MVLLLRALYLLLERILLSLSSLRKSFLPVDTFKSKEMQLYLRRSCLHLEHGELHLSLISLGICIE